MAKVRHNYRAFLNKKAIQRKKASTKITEVLARRNATPLASLLESHSQNPNVIPARPQDGIRRDTTITSPSTCKPISQEEVGEEKVEEVRKKEEENDTCHMPPYPSEVSDFICYILSDYILFPHRGKVRVLTAHKW